MLPPAQPAAYWHQQVSQPRADFYPAKAALPLREQHHPPSYSQYQPSPAAEPGSFYQQSLYSSIPAAGLPPPYQPQQQQQQQLQYLPPYTPQPLPPQPWPSTTAAPGAYPSLAYQQQQHAYYEPRHLEYMSEEVPRNNGGQQRQQRQRGSKRRYDAADDDDWIDDEEENDGSCSSADLSYSSRHRGNGAPAAGTTRQGRPAAIKAAQRWTQEEHDKLIEVVGRFGNSRRWSEIAKHIPGRTGKQCRERWVNHMNPDTKKGSWDVAEELLLCKWHSILGSHWARITRKLEGRTENAVKNHWNAAMRSKFPMRRSTPLNMYVAHLRNDVEPSDALVKVLEALQEQHPELVAQTARAAADIVSRRLNPQSGAALAVPPNIAAAAGAQIQQLGALGGLSGRNAALRVAGAALPTAAAAAVGHPNTAANLTAFFNAAGQPNAQIQQQLMLQQERQSPLQNRSPAHAVLTAAQPQLLPGLLPPAPDSAEATLGVPTIGSAFAADEGASAALAAATVGTTPSSVLQQQADARFAAAADTPSAYAPPSVQPADAAQGLPAAAAAAADGLGHDVVAGLEANNPHPSTSTHSSGSGLGTTGSGQAAAPVAAPSAAGTAAAAVGGEAAPGQQVQLLQVDAAGAVQNPLFHSPNMTSTQSNTSTLPAAAVAAAMTLSETSPPQQQQMLLPGQPAAPPLFQPRPPAYQQQLPIGPPSVLAAAAAAAHSFPNAVQIKARCLAADAVVAVRNGAARLLIDLQEGQQAMQQRQAAELQQQQQQQLAGQYRLPTPPGLSLSMQHSPNPLLRTHTAPAAQLQHWQSQQQQWHHAIIDPHLFHPPPQQQQRAEAHPTVSGDSFSAMIAAIAGGPPASSVGTAATAGQAAATSMPPALAAVEALPLAAAAATASGLGDGSAVDAQAARPDTPVTAALQGALNPAGPHWQQQQHYQLHRSQSERISIPGVLFDSQQLPFTMGSLKQEPHDPPARQLWQQRDTAAAPQALGYQTVTTDAPTDRRLGRTISAPAIRAAPVVSGVPATAMADAETGTIQGNGVTQADDCFTMPMQTDDDVGAQAVAAGTPASHAAVNGLVSTELPPLFPAVTSPLPDSSLHMHDMEELHGADKEFMDMLSQ